MDRRRFLKATAGSGVIGLAIPAAFARKLSATSETTLRGSIDATDFGVRSDSGTDQSVQFRKMLDQASRRNVPLFLRPGRYLVSDISLPSRTRITGVPGATRIVQSGTSFFHVQGSEEIDLSGLILDGAGLSLEGGTDGLLDLKDVRRLTIENCSLVGSAKHGLALQRVGGRIARSTISAARDAGIHSIDATGIDIRGNHVTDCGNGGILVWRSKQADDRTLVSGNRVERVRADDGGTGQNGNGINAYLADNVIITGNIVSDCAFSAIRANSSSNVQIGNNTCLRSGETAIYSEFSFEGAVINANIVDGAANGISIVNFDSGGRLGACSANIIRNLSDTGPYAPQGVGFGTGISVEADCAVSNNVIEDAPLFGIQIGWGAFMRNIVATGNVIRKAGVGIAVSIVDGTGMAVIANNIIDGARNGAIVGYRWAKPATKDLALEGSEKLRNIEIGKNRVG